MNDNKQFPKVLIVSNCSLDEQSQTSITLKNVWGLWPRECLMEYIVSDVQAVDHRGNVFFLSSNRRPIALIANSRFATKLNSDLKSIKHQGEVRNSRKGRIKTIKTKLRQYAYSITDRSPLVFLPKDFDAVKAFNPDIIYTMGSTITTLKIAIKLSNITGKSIIIHFMDNWPETIQWGDNNLLKGYQNTLKKWLRKAYEHSQCSLTISEEMAIDYEKKTGIKHFPLMNSVIIEDWKCEDKKNNHTINLIYAGGLHLGRDKTLIDLYNQLTRLNCTTEQKYRLSVYTNLGHQSAKELEKIADGETLIVNGYVPHGALKEIYEGADILIIAEALSSDEVTELFTKYSVSTKTAEYLATGKPILYIGDKERVLPKYLLKHGAAVVINDPGEISHAISEIISRYDELSRNGISLAKTNHNKKNTNMLLKRAIEYKKAFI